MADLIIDAKAWMARGVWDKDVLFVLLSRDHRVHYATVRKAIHIAKTEIYS